ncbi:MAG: DUF1871 family protein [Acidobacteriota bacterium]
MENSLLFSRIREIIKAWDPERLLALGAPEDEYEGEVRDILSMINEISYPDDATKIIADIFSRSFSSSDGSYKVVYKLEHCCNAGEQVWKAIRYYKDESLSR